MQAVVMSSDPAFVQDQYSRADKLRIRIETHQRYSWGDTSCLLDAAVHARCLFRKASRGRENTTTPGHTALSMPQTRTGDRDQTLTVALKEQSIRQKSSGRKIVMCTFRDDRTAEVCDVAIAHVRREVDAAFAGKIRYTHVDGQPTLVEAALDVDAAAFQARSRAAIAAAQSGA